MIAALSSAPPLPLPYADHLTNMFYNQPLSVRFGTDLKAHIASGHWTSLEIAVAWVRASGMAHLTPSLSAFLQAGHRVRVVVGVDLDNTSKEGLESLLALQTCGAIDTVVYHNEAGTVFHPKLYLFQSATTAKLVVGSNNLTEAGLYQNVEAGLELNCPITDPTVVAARNALDAWRDTSLGTALVLDAALLADLLVNGYVQPEAKLNADRATRRQSATGTSAAGSKKLFASIPVTPPSKPPGAAPGKAPPKATPGGPATKPSPGITPAATPASPTGQALLMRIRKAHVTDRPTQTQLPKSVANSAFFGGIGAVRSVHSGQSHQISQAVARGIVNTLKLEIPEMRFFTDPVIRFERTAAGIQYEVYDSSSVKGATIMAALQHGRTTSPPATDLTLPSDPSRSTWWRFI